MKAVVARFALLGLILPLAACPLAQVKDDDPYAQRVRSLEERIDRTEKQLDTQSLVQLMQEIESLREEVRSLRGQVEQLDHDIDGVRQRQRDIYMDVDQRLQLLENTTASAGNGQSSSKDANASEAYMTAFGLLRESRYGESRKAFTAFIKDYPDSSLVANAHYWLGQIDYVNKQYAEAIKSFKTVADTYPDSDKAADALLKIGYSQDEMGEASAARSTLESVAKRYPGSSAANSAASRLKELAGG
jgi:tol-pal system protein YbgF